VVFTGNVQLEQSRGTMSGERVVYNLKTGAIDSGGPNNGRVHMRILPKTTAPAPVPPDTTPAKTTP
jgi:lipopolysaccharide export system protein LptA